MDIPKGLSAREKQLWGSFRLSTPITASSGKFAHEAYQRWKDLKLADDAQRQNRQDFDSAHPYESKAGVLVAETHGSKGTGTFQSTPPTNTTSTPKAKAVNNEYD